VTLDLKNLARALGGHISGDQVLAPGPDHSPGDRSMSIALSTSTLDGFVVNSFAGDDPKVCKDYIRLKLGLAPFQVNDRHRPSVSDGTVDAALRAAAAGQQRTNGRIVATYDYQDADGTLLYQVVRLDPKSFRHRKPDGRGDWIWQGNKQRVPYRLPDLLKYPDGTVFVCEGEKDADRVAGLEHCATTVASGEWTDDCVKALAGRDVLILEDNDDAGRKKAVDAATALWGAAKTIRIVRLPDLADKGDVSDWLDQGHTAAELEDVCYEAPLWDAALAPVSVDAPAPLPATKTRDNLNSLRASKVAMSAITWMWPERFAVGKLGLLAGLPDEGIAPKGNVILLTAEDDLSDTVVPRLMAAGADLERVEIITMVKSASGERMFNLIDDLDLLRKKIDEIGDVVMVQIDPLSAYFGVKKADSFRTTDVRAVLAPLVQLAADTKVAIIGVLHFNKKLDVTNALLRISDSLAFGATARHVYAIIDDAENNRKLMVKGKNNLAISKQKALAYEFSIKEVGTDPDTGEMIVAPHIIWQREPVDVTASEAMQAATENRSPGARDEAKEFLLDYLAGGPMPADTVKEAAEANGVSERTLRRAMKELRIKPRQEEKQWFWELRPSAGRKDLD
jgi:putative DNA primase/helicase